MPEIPTLQIDQATRDVRINGAPVAIGARAFDVLVYLSRHSGRVVSKVELLDMVWGGLAVEEGNLSVQISALRKALGPKLIATVPGVGYQLAMPEDVPAASVPARAAPPVPAKPSLAVLPFAKLTGDPGNDYLVDGIVTDLIGSLSRISGIFVIAATSSFAYKGQAVRLSDIDTNLGVRYVLEGSIQKAYDLVLRALPHIYRVQTLEDFRKGIALLDQAIARDPGYAMAKAWKVRAYLIARGARMISWEENLEAAPLAQALLADAGDDPLVLAFAGQFHAFSG